MEGKYLITTDQWFFAPDGRQYKAVFGECKILADDILGIKTNSRSTNWYVQVGDDAEHIIIAGCNIHYAIKCNEVNGINGWEEDNLKNEIKCQTRIFIPGRRGYIGLPENIKPNFLTS